MTRRFACVLAAWTAMAAAPLAGCRGLDLIGRSPMKLRGVVSRGEVARSAAVPGRLDLLEDVQSAGLRPLGGVQVTVFNVWPDGSLSNERLVTTFSNPDGSYYLGPIPHIDADKVTIFFAKEGYEPGSLETDFFASRTLRVDAVLVERATPEPVAAGYRPGSEAEAAAEAAARQKEEDGRAHRRHMATGTDLLRRGLVGEALVEFQQAVDRVNDSREALVQVGNCHFVLARYEEAARSYQRAIDLERDRGEYHLYLGLARLRQERFPEALEALQQAVALEPQRAEAHAYRGEAFLRQQELDRALASFQEALRLDPTDARLHLRLGGVLREKRDYPGALEHLRRYVALAPEGDPEARLAAATIEEVEAIVARLEERRWQEDEARRVRERKEAERAYSYGRELVALSRFEEAVPELERALALDPAMLEAYVLVARCHLARRRADLAVGVLEAAARREDATAVVLAALGDAQWVAGAPAAAADAYRRALALDPRSMDALHGLGRTRVAEGDDREAVRLYLEYRAVADRRPEERERLAAVEAYLARQVDEVRAQMERREAAERAQAGERARAAFQEGLAFLRDGRHEEAVLSLEHARALLPGSGWVHLYLGLARTRLGQVEEARTGLRLAGDYAPRGDVEFLRQLASAFVVLGDLGEARKVYGRLLGLAPGDVAALFDLAQIARGLGEVLEAQGLYRQVLALDPVHARALHALGAMAFQERRDDESRQLLEGFLRLAERDPALEAERGEARAALEAMERRRPAPPPREVPPGGGGEPLGPPRPPRDAGGAGPAPGAEGAREAARAGLAEGLAHAQSGRWAAAEASYRAALALDPGTAEVHLRLAVALREQGRSQDAFRSVEEALRLQPGHVEAREELARLYLDGDNFVDAARELERASREAPERPSVHYRLGLAYEGQKQLGKAVQSFRRALGLDPDLHAAGYRLGFALKALGRTEEAAAAFTLYVQGAADVPGEAEGVQEARAQIAELRARMEEAGGGGAR
ncbi:MAG: tetratricopeptide repeat protein [Planctomycetes bacterium]|nr:tetratricopeptide repeat protein [Planctomycetota bacterium]